MIILNLIKYIVYSNIWISFGAVFFTLNYYVTNGITPNIFLLAFVFFSTLFTYTFQRFVKIKLNINCIGERAEWMRSNKILVVFLLLSSLLLSIYFSFFFLEKIWLLFLICGFLSFFYVWKVPGLKGKNLRDLPGLKIFLISTVWVFITVLMPCLVNDHQNAGYPIVILIAELLFLISITIPFDIRDVNLDESTKKTIPQLMGVKKSTYMSIILMISSQVLFQSLFPTINWGIVIVTIVAIVLLYRAKPNRNELYFSGVIDGLLILQPVLMYLFNF